MFWIKLVFVFKTNSEQQSKTWLCTDGVSAVEMSKGLSVLQTVFDRLSNNVLNPFKHNFCNFLNSTIWQSP